MNADAYWLLAEQKAVPAVARKGVTRPYGKAVKDASGLYHPLRLTFFWAYQGWTRDRARFMQNIDFLVPYRYDSVRILAQVDWPDWAINPDDPMYRQNLGETIDYLYSRGLKVGLCVQGSAYHDSIGLANKVCDVILSRPEKIESVEMANEYDVAAHVSIPTMQAMVDVFKARGCQNILALSSPGDGSSLVSASFQSGCQGFTVHTDRRNLDHGWNWVEQGYGFKDLNFVNCDDEPPGPAASAGGNCTNVLQLVMMRAIAVMCGAAEYTLHVASMVFGKAVPGPPTRQANLWEVPNIDATLRCVRQIDALLPLEVENWRVCIESFRESPFIADRYWPPQNDHGLFKPYAAIHGSQWIQMPIGVWNFSDLIAKYALRNVRFYHPLTLALVKQADHVAQGEIVRIDGAADTMSAYIILGEL